VSGMSPAPFHLGWFLNGFRVHGWDTPWIGSTLHHWMEADFYRDFARSLERAGFDYLILEDSAYVPDGYGSSHDYYLKNAMHVPKHDPAVLGSILTQYTKRLGIVVTLSVTEYAPYMLARQMSTLDHMSRGRAGWNVVTSSSDRSAQNYGKDGHPQHDERYDIADEFAELVYKLWGSWEADALVLDVEGGMFADPSKVHTVDFQGKYFRSRGPLNTAPPPQGRPVIVQAGGSPRGREFASKHADSIIASVPEVSKMKEYRDDVRERMVGHGRKPDDCKVLFLTSPILGETREEAKAKYDRYVAYAREHPEIKLANMGFATDVDFYGYDVDTPLGELVTQFKTNGHQSSLADFLRMAQNQTLREVAATTRAVDFVGTPDDVAAQMAEAMEEVGGDGFLFTLGELTHRSISEITDGLVPALQRRGLTRRDYGHEQFRDNLLEF
jgi:FMN-dependent oxidoreductase (nitrilotriacetate monooxygenase family)